MIGRYTLLGLEGKEVSLKDISNLNVGVIDDYRGEFGRAFFQELIKNEDFTFLFYDFHRYFKRESKNIVRLYAGYDIKFPPFNIYDDSDNYLLIADLLDSILNFYGFRDNRWKTILVRSLEDALRRSDNTFKGLIQEFMSLKNESSGVEKELYTHITNIFRMIFTYDDIEKIGGEFEELHLKSVDNRVIIDLSLIKNFIGRHFLMTIYYLYFRREQIYQILPYADYLFKSNLVSLHILKLRDGKCGNLYFIENFDRILCKYLDVIYLKNKYLPIYHKFLRNIPIESYGSNYSVVEQFITSFINVPQVEVTNEEERIERVKLDSNYIVKYKKEIQKMLSHILENKRSSIDGIVIASGIDKRLAYSLVERLWREGYIKRVASNAGVFYRISVKGMKFLRGVE